MKEIEFNLLTEPWIRVRLRDNTVREVSLTEALVSAQDYADLAGEMPTQNAAVLRLLLAPLHLFTKLPVVHGVNAILGGALGLVKGALLLFFAVWLLRRFQILVTPELIGQTYILRFFAEHSPMELITSL